jgi:hypothetical protein
MKKILFFSAICLMTCVVFAQTAQVPPQAFKYQAVVRDIDGNVVANRNVRVRVSILRDWPPGYQVYQEEHLSLRSNAYGMINFDIGRGAQTSTDAFNRIDWGRGTHHIQLELDILTASGTPTGYTNLGTTELLSVPYALYAGNARAGGGGGGGGFNHELRDRAIPFFRASDEFLLSSSVTFDADSTITIDGPLRIGTIYSGYVFPSTPGTASQILVLNAGGDSLVWRDNTGTGSGGSTDWERGEPGSPDAVDGGTLLRNLNSGSVIIGGRPNPFPTGTNAQLHVEGGFVVKTTTATTIPYNFTDGSSGMMWWGGDKQAFRVGRLNSGDDPSGNFSNAWSSTNIGKSSIGIGTNILAKGEGTFGIGRNLFIDTESFAVGMDSEVDRDYAFSVGMDNIVSGELSMAIGVNNDIVNADMTSIVGTGNEYSIFDPIYQDRLTRSFIAGHGNIITESDQNVFVLGRDNTAHEAPYTLFLGQDNKVKGNNAYVTTNLFSILIGKENTLESNAINNILIGRNNLSPHGGDVIALGGDLTPSKNSIFIGQNNKSDHNLGNTNNIVMGFDIDLKMNAGSPAKNSVLIGGNITEPGHFDFVADHVISIGTNIHTYGQYDGHLIGKSVNIGNNIRTNSAQSINIGNRIQIEEFPDRLDNQGVIAIGNDIHFDAMFAGFEFVGGGLKPPASDKPIAIGNNITFPASITHAGAVGNVTIGYKGTIIMGTNFPEKYPYMRKRAASPITYVIAPRFVIAGTTHNDIWLQAVTPGPPAPVNEGKQDLNYLYIDDYANVFIGSRTNSPSNSLQGYLSDASFVGYNTGVGPNNTDYDLTRGQNYGGVTGSTVFARAMVLGNTEGDALQGTSQPGRLTLLSSGTGIGNIAILNVGGAVPGSANTTPTAPVPVIPGDTSRITNTWLAGGSRGGVIYVPGVGGTTAAPQSGRVFAQSGFVAGSDRKFKKNISPLTGESMEGYLHRISSYSYTREGDTTNQLNWGFMAQDVQQFFPHLVYEIEAFGGGLGIDYISFIPVLWAINQDQQTQIDRQRRRIQELEKQVRFINDFNADELTRQQNRIADLEKKLDEILKKLE